MIAELRQLLIECRDGGLALLQQVGDEGLLAVVQSLLVVKEFFDVVGFFLFGYTERSILADLRKLGTAGARPPAHIYSLPSPTRGKGCHMTPLRPSAEEVTKGLKTMMDHVEDGGHVDE